MRSTKPTRPGPAPEPFELPDTTDLAAVNAAEVEVIRLATQRRLGPRDALRFTRMLEHRRRAIADTELEAEMERLEKEAKALRAGRS
jgi:hypothetical protein